MTKCDFCTISVVSNGKASCPYYTPSLTFCEDAIKNMVKALQSEDKDSKIKKFFS